MGTPTFIVNSIPINPGLPSTFPWLSTPAAGYNYYHFRSLIIRYITRDNTTDRGTVCLAWDPNPDHASPINMLNAENYETKIAISPWQTGQIDVPPEDLNRLKKFLVRNALIASEFDTYDVGQIFVCTSGNTNTGLIGELFLDFVVEFHAPIPNQLNLLPQPDANSYWTQSASLLLPNTGTAVTIPWDTVVSNPIGVVNTGGVFTGLRGALVVYLQATVAPNAAITSSSLAIQVSVNGGTTWVNQQVAAFTAGATLATTQNVEFIVQLLPTYSFRTVISVQTGTAGNSAAFPSGITNGVLVLTPA
jgi:hypothetical protein